VEDNKKYCLNEHGRRYWTSKADSSLTATRAYHWVDRVIFIEEFKGDRLCVGETTFTKFLEVEDAWTPMTVQEYEELLEKHRNECN
jgi:hypothetical protein